MILKLLFGLRVSVCKHIINGERPHRLFVNWFDQLHCSCGLGDHEYKEEFHKVLLSSLDVSKFEKKILKSLKNMHSARLEDGNWNVAMRPMESTTTKRVQDTYDEMHEKVRENGGFWVSGNGNDIGKMTGKDGFGQVPIWLKKPIDGTGLNDPLFSGAVFFLNIKEFETSHRADLEKYLYRIVVNHNGEFPNCPGQGHSFIIPISDFLCNKNERLPSRLI